MKRITLCLLMLSAVCAAQAQSNAHDTHHNYDVGFGLQIGYINDRPQERIGKNEKYTKGTPLNGLKVGLLHEVNFYKGLGMVYGLNYAYLANKTDWETDGYIVSKQTRTREQQHLLEVPLHLQYKITIARQTYFILNAGPEFSYMLSRTSTLYTKNSNANISGNEDKVVTNMLTVDADGDGKYDNSPFNLQVNVGIGFQFHNAQIKSGYSFGVLNTQKDTYYDVTSKYWYSRQNEWNVRLIYIF